MSTFGDRLRLLSPVAAPRQDMMTLYIEGYKKKVAALKQEGKLDAVAAQGGCYYDIETVIKGDDATQEAAMKSLNNVFEDGLVYECYEMKNVSSSDDEVILVLRLEW